MKIAELFPYAAALFAFPQIGTRFPRSSRFCKVYVVTRPHPDQIWTVTAEGLDRNSGHGPGALREATVLASPALRSYGKTLFAGKDSAIPPQLRRSLAPLTSNQTHKPRYLPSSLLVRAGTRDKCHSRHWKRFRRICRNDVQA